MLLTLELAMMLLVWLGKGGGSSESLLSLVSHLLPIVLVVLLCRAHCNHRSWQLDLSIFFFFLSFLSPLLSGLLLPLPFLLQVLLPVPCIRRPTLRPIGRRSTTLLDPTRPIISSSRPRPIPLSVLYPAAAGPSSPSLTLLAPLFDHFDVVGTALVNVLPAIPDWLRPVIRGLLGHVNGPSSALADAPADGQVRRLVVLLHGITGPRWQYISLAEHLSEHGFVVLLPEHPFDTACCVVPGQPPLLYNLGRPPADDDYGPAWSEWHGYLEQRLLDTNLVIEWMRGGADGQLKQWGIEIDWRQGVSLVGHSFGACEAVELSRRNPGLFKNCVGHDMWLYPLDPNNLEPPSGRSLFISSQRWQWPRNRERIRRLSSAALLRENKVDHFNLVLRDARHHNFHDLALIAPLVGKALGMLGAGDPAAQLKAVNDATVAFLCGKTIPKSTWLLEFVETFPDKTQSVESY